MHTVLYQELSHQAQQLLNKLGYKNIKYRVGDGKLGWPESAPFDKIIVTALAQEIPSKLVEQLKNGGKMILPLAISPSKEYLILLNKSPKGKIEYKKLIPVRFVPLK